MHSILSKTLEQEFAAIQSALDYFDVLDLGLRGLRQAKKSYDPLQIIIPYTLIFTLP